MEAGLSPDEQATVHRLLRIRSSAAQIIGAVLAAVSGALTSAGVRGQPGFQLVDLIAFFAYVPVTVVVGSAFFTRRVKRATVWLDEQRDPTPDEQRDALGLAGHISAGSMLGWVGAAIVWSALTAYDHSAGTTVRVALSILLGGLTACGLTYLLVEWTLRPVTAQALAGHVPEVSDVPGTRTKLVLSWAVGADVFLLMIGLTYVGRPASDPPRAAAIWFICATGLVAGSLILYAVTRSLVTPLADLRRAVRRVQHGDIDVQLTVNDSSELGLLQAGFNQMVDGLRERAILQDLFGRHVGEDVARQALERGDVVLGGQRREVAVVFVDVIGSTVLAQSRSAQDVVTVLNRFFSAVVRVVEAEGGWVNKFEGDGALCVFGAPVASADYAARALRAARVLRRELLSLSATNPELDAGIGVSAGAAIAGNIGAEHRFEYTVIGTPVNEAARLTDEAKRRLGRVLASEEAVSRAGAEATQWHVSGELRLRGLDEPVLAYEPGPAAAVRQSPDL
ncbi:MAG TPA: adenylate/guanylate cyclase domain-containing protein [Acidimicrobiales bacterium]|nr:adenylate/guanylate cyclase domain-containing protein [Acidimicrobiales bacterium]